MQTVLAVVTTAALILWSLFGSPKASNIKNIAKLRTWAGDMDLSSTGTGGATMKLLLAMTNTTADTDIDSSHVGDLATLDEMDGANYARVTLANQTVVEDTTNDLAYFDADDVTFTSLGNGTRQVQGALIFQFITNDAGSFMFCWVEFASTINPGGSNLTIQWNAGGIAKQV